jgi:hypothetical protein
VAFNGANHLVVFGVRTPSGSQAIVGQRVSPSGDQLDGPGGVKVCPYCFRPAVASDGDGWIVVWMTPADGLVMARVSAHGVVGPSSTLGSPNNNGAAVAFGAGVYLVAWAEGPEGAMTVKAARVRPDLTVLDDPALEIFSSVGPTAAMVGAIAFDGSKFLVTWYENLADRTDIYAARVAADGTLLDGPAGASGFVVNALSTDWKSDPVAAFDGEQFFVAWAGGHGSQEGWVYRISGARVATDGVVLDGPTSSQGLPIWQWGGWSPTVAKALDGQTVVAWGEGPFLIGTGTSEVIRAGWYGW